MLASRAIMAPKQQKKAQKGASPKDKKEAKAAASAEWSEETRSLMRQVDRVIATNTKGWSQGMISATVDGRSISAHVTDAAQEARGRRGRLSEKFSGTYSHTIVPVGGFRKFGRRGWWGAGTLRCRCTHTHMHSNMLTCRIRSR